MSQDRSTLPAVAKATGLFFGFVVAVESIGAFISSRTLAKHLFGLPHDQPSAAPAGPNKRLDPSRRGSSASLGLVGLSHGLSWAILKYGHGDAVRSWNWYHRYCCRLEQWGEARPLCASGWEHHLGSCRWISCVCCRSGLNSTAHDE